MKPSRKEDVRIHAQNHGGFTLVEMLLVLAILTVLAAIVYPRIINRLEDGRRTAAVVQIKAFGTALDMFELDNGFLPKSQPGLVELMQRPSQSPNWHGPYVEDLPKDPWGNAYVYTFPGKFHPASYDIISAGHDGVLGTPDDIMNLQKAGTPLTAGAEQGAK